MINVCQCSNRYDCVFCNGDACCFNSYLIKKYIETIIICLFVWVNRCFETCEVISRRCLLVAVVL